MKIDIKYKDILLDALEDRMYKVSMRLNGMRGQAMNRERKRWTRLQKEIERLQHVIYTSEN